MSSVAHAHAGGSPEEAGKVQQQQQRHEESNDYPTATAVNGDGVSVDTIDVATQKRVVRKLDWNIIPLVTTLYLLAFLDRSNIGNARIAGMKEDLNLDSDRYDWLLTVFYISYIVFEFQAIMWKLMPPHIWAAIVVFCWGLFSTVQAATVNWGGMVALRFLMGWAEAGYGPGIPFLLSFFYLREEIGIRCAIFLGAAPLASTFSGALAYGITSGDAGIANWRLLFIVEGAPTVLMAFVAFFFLPDSPDTARFLTLEEKLVAKARSQKQVGTEKRSGGANWREIGAALLDPKAWITALMYFSCNVSFSSLPVFLPTIIAEMGFDKVTAQGLTAPPFFFSWIITILSAFVADRIKQRGFTIAIVSAIAGVGYILLATVESTSVRYFGVFLAAAGVFPAIANILPWVLNNQGTDSRRGAGIVLLNTVGQCGPLLGTRIFPSKEGPFYVKGQAICAGFIFFNMFLALSLRALLKWENKKLDKQYGTLVEQNDRARQGVDKVESTAGEENYGPRYRYAL